MIRVHQVAAMLKTRVQVGHAAEKLHLIARDLTLPLHAPLRPVIADIRNHWAEWRVEWEGKVARNEMQFLRSVADLHAGFQHRSDLMDANHRELVGAQHKAFEGALERFTIDIQKRLWADLERIRLEYERLIYSELKTIRQRAAVSVGQATPAATTEAVKA